MIRPAILAVLVSGGLAGCGDAEDEAPAGGEAGGTTGTSGDVAADPSEEASAAGPGSGTLTMADGTVYELDMSTCDTSDNAEGFLLPNSYDLFGTTSDGAFAASFNRAGLDADFVTEIVTLEGDFDENGQNAGIIYSNEVDSIALIVDGGDVSGTVTLKAVGPVGPHGDRMEATADITC